MSCSRSTPIVSVVVRRVPFSNTSSSIGDVVAMNSDPRERALGEPSARGHRDDEASNAATPPIPKRERHRGRENRLRAAGACSRRQSRAQQVATSRSPYAFRSTGGPARRHPRERGAEARYERESSTCSPEASGRRMARELSSERLAPAALLRMRRADRPARRPERGKRPKPTRDRYGRRRRRRCLLRWSSTRFPFVSWPMLFEPILPRVVRRCLLATQLAPPCVQRRPALSLLGARPLLVGPLPLLLPALPIDLSPPLVRSPALRALATPHACPLMLPNLRSLVPARRLLVRATREPRQPVVARHRLRPVMRALRETTTQGTATQTTESLRSATTHSLVAG